MFNGLNRLNGIGQLDPGNTRCSTRANNFASTLDNACILQSTEACILNAYSELNDQTNFGFNSTACGT